MSTLSHCWLILSRLSIIIDHQSLLPLTTDDQMGLIMKYFLWSGLSLPLIQEGQLSVSVERMCTILVNGLED